MKYNINNIDNISELSISDNIKIITLSDIHGDIQSLIIALRDCGNVIKKKKDFIFDNKSIDNNLEELLLIDISNNEDNYIDDLNYEWCGDNTHIVIVGDILDAKRDEFVNIYADQRVAPMEKTNITNLLKEIDPANSSKYQAILDSK